MNALVLICMIGWTCVSAHFLYNPYYKFSRYGYPSFHNSIGNYASHVPTYGPYVPPYTSQFYGNPVQQITHALPSINLLAEAPYTVEKQFSVVPMLVVSNENIHMMQSVQIMGMSKKKPTMTVKTNKNTLMQCTPAVRIVLRTPILVYNLKSSILFPSSMSILYGNARIPIRIGAVIAPVTQTAYVSEETPISITVVYAIPTRPIKFDYVNNEKDTVVDQDGQSVVVDSAKQQAGQRVPILHFPEAVAEPMLTVDDDELVNRNPLQPVIPAGIVQSTQPHTTLELFTNSKESAVLTELREEAKKRI